MELQDFIAGWEETPTGVKGVFIELKNVLEALDGVEVLFEARPGITYSLRGRKPSQSDRPLFVMIDVIDDDPTDRWLSVCFYGDTITDPDELGDFVPGGLLNGDGHCFDVEGADLTEYISARIKEAYSNQ